MGCVNCGLDDNLKSKLTKLCLKLVSTFFITAPIFAMCESESLRLAYWHGKRNYGITQEQVRLLLNNVKLLRGNIVMEPLFCILFRRD